MRYLATRPGCLWSHFCLHDNARSERGQKCSFFRRFLPTNSPQSVRISWPVGIPVVDGAGSGSTSTCETSWFGLKYCFVWSSALMKTKVSFCGVSMWILTVAALLYFPFPPELVQPKALTFSEVGSRSFRASWEIENNNVEAYVVQFKPEGDLDNHYVSMSVPGDRLTTVLPHLSPLTRYEVIVYAQYEKGDSLPVTGYETTLEGIYYFYRCRCCRIVWYK